MNEEQFKQNFISTFLASWCADHYDEFNKYGRYCDLKRPPVDDAIDLAKHAWADYAVKAGLITPTVTP
jgi:hypothetical protein